MIILVIDTSQRLCSVALMINSTDIYYKRSVDIDSHSKVLFSLIDSIFLNSGYSYDDITDIGVVVGPGSFTGIRAGVATARGISLVLSKKLHGVSIFEMQAYYYISSFPESETDEVITVFRARDNLVYVQVFNRDLVATTDIILNHKIYHKSDFIAQEILDSILNAELACSVLYKKLVKNLKINDPKPIYLHAL